MKNNTSANLSRSTTMAALPHMILLLIFALQFFAHPLFSQEGAAESESTQDRNELKGDQFPYFDLEERQGEAAEGEPFTNALLKMGVTLALLVAFMYFASWVLKRVLASRSQQLNLNSAIKIIEQRPLSHKSALYIAQIQKKTVVLGESASGLTLLMELSSDGDALPSSEH